MGDTPILAWIDSEISELRNLVMEINLLVHNYHDVLLKTPQLHAELESSLVLAKEGLRQSLEAVLAKDERRTA